MEKNFKFICGNNKYTISATNTISLPVQLENLPSEVVIDNDKLLLKSSFHVSLVCINEIIKKYEVLTSNFVDLMEKDFCEFTKINNVSLLNYLEEFKFVVQNDQKSTCFSNHTSIVQFYKNYTDAIIFEKTLFCFGEAGSI